MPLTYAGGTKTIGLALAGAALALTGCSGSDEGDSATPSTGTSASAAPLVGEFVGDTAPGESPAPASEPASAAPAASPTPVSGIAIGQALSNAYRDQHQQEVTFKCDGDLQPQVGYQVKCEAESGSQTASYNVTVDELRNGEIIWGARVAEAG